MAARENKAIARRIFEEVINTGDLSLADQFIAQEMVSHNNPPDAPSGIEGFKHFVTTFRAAFPDLTFTIEDMITERDKVVARVSLRGTHKGDFMGVPATGRSVEMDSIDIMRFAEGKLIEHWGQGDVVGLMQQLGAVMPPTAQTVR
jgi:steroid delta-isomerase-like uncharacterized protein